MKSFEKWEYQDIEMAFGISQVKTMSALSEWLKAEEPITEIEKIIIKQAQNTFYKFVDGYNEDEIKFFFISRIFEVVEFVGDNYRAFSQRKMSAKVKDIKGKEIDLFGRVELLVAKGYQKPLVPYFFLNEYKPEQKSGNDPRGQLLATMVAAQHLNSIEEPIYGAYVNGRNWFFLVLDKKEYALSNAYNSTDEDVYKIVSILKKCKQNADAFFKKY